ncbi:hypothetical protein [Sphingomonas sp. 2378]|uniref:hypothetical protein n=1 Tax=Sphingomonas sp. 2378 TaxID=1219748 RepID=UPI00311ABFBD
MRFRTLLPLTTMAAAIAGCTPTPAQQARIEQAAATNRADLTAALRGLTPGKPTQCIGQYTTRQVNAYGPTIVYTISPRLKFVSQTAGGCEGIGQRSRNDILVTRTTTGQLCSGDIAQTVDRTSGFFTGSCSFGAFVPYRKER